MLVESFDFYSAGKRLCSAYIVYILCQTKQIYDYQIILIVIVNNLFVNYNINFLIYH